MAATLTFLSSLQRGLSAGIATTDAPDAAPGPRVSSQFDLDFGQNHLADVKLDLVGPGDIIGLDTRAIVRTFPRRDDNDSEFQHFAMIESDQADLPWRYTPAKPDGDVVNGVDD